VGERISEEEKKIEEKRGEKKSIIETGLRLGKVKGRGTPSERSGRHVLSPLA